MVHSRMRWNPNLNPGEPDAFIALVRFRGGRGVGDPAFGPDGPIPEAAPTLSNF